MLGETFLGKAPKSPVEHLYIVISDARTGNGDVAFVNLTTWRADKEQTCVVEVGEHPFVTTRSVVAFQHAANAAVVNIQDGIAKGVLRPNTAASAELVRKLQSACLVSVNARREVKRLVQLCLSGGVVGG